SEDGDDADINAAGYVVPGAIAEALAHWTVEGVTAAPAGQALIIDRCDRPADPTLGDRLEQVGARVTRIQADGTAAMLVPPHRATVPENIVAAIIRWFEEWRLAPSPAGASGRESGGTLRQLRESAACRERAVRFGADDRLFGMLASPTRDTGAPSIILLNTGVEHHVGPHRLYVPLSREWAARGHHVLRYDLGGIGDSEPPAAMSQNVAYPAHLLDDAREAVAFIHEVAPRRPVIMAGLCSGGWLAFRAAREGLAVDAIVAVNAPLYLRDDAVGTRWRAELEEFAELVRYQKSLRDPSRWAKAFTGRASYATFARIVAGAVRRRVTTRLDLLKANARLDGLAGDLDAIARRGIRALFIFSSGDGGFEYYQLHAPPAFRRPNVSECIRHVVIEGAGHSFRPRAAQQALRELLVDFVTSRSDATI
ncbi:MAG: alpha/beta fold hydrolase, partial [Burkholderiales bacterium]